jgi:PadR family transcriptional regulator, regulatory protein PadR
MRPFAQPLHRMPRRPGRPPRCYDAATMSDPLAREFLLAFWKIHILHHAGERGGVYGQWMIGELRRHGHDLSPGTLYPLLARMTRHGWLRAGTPRRSAAKGPHTYHLTAEGRRVLRELRAALDELYHEVADTGGRGSGPSRPTAPRGLTRRPR